MRHLVLAHGVSVVGKYLTGDDAQVATCKYAIAFGEAWGRFLVRCGHGKRFYTAQLTLVDGKSDEVAMPSGVRWFADCEIQTQAYRNFQVVRQIIQADDGTSPNLRATVKGLLADERTEFELSIVSHVGRS